MPSSRLFEAGHARLRSIGLSLGIAVMVGAGLVAIPASAGSQRAGTYVPPAFGRNHALSGETAGSVGAGGEPSMAIDHNGSLSSVNDIYVAAIGTASGLPEEWHSYDLGKTWSLAVPYDNGQCGTAPGGDNDVAVLSQGDVVVNDLNITHATVQVSKNHGQSFPAACTATAPEDDRPWLTTQGTSTIYVAYHDFAAEVPVVCTSTDEGSTFTCNQAFTSTVVSPGNHPGTSVSECLENTIPSRPLVIDPTDGSLNFMYSCSTTIQNVQDPPYGPLHDYYLAKSTDGGVTWNSTPVYIADTSNGKSPNLAGIFGQLTSDASGNYYALFAGTMDDTHVLTNPWHVYLMTLAHGSSTWKGPFQVDPGKVGTHVFPAMVATGNGDLDIVWEAAYKPSNNAIPVTGEPNGVCGTFAQIASGNPQPCLDGTKNVGMHCENIASYCPANGGGPVQADWFVEMTQSTNASSGAPTFSAPVKVTREMHEGEICVNGLVCANPSNGQPYSDRSMLDFISVAVDCNGAAHVTYAANAEGSTPAYRAIINEADQTAGAVIAAPAACKA